MERADDMNGAERIGITLAHEAADLWLRLQARPADASLIEEVARWRARSSEHDRTFRAAGAVWALAGTCAQAGIDAPQAPRHDRRRWAMRPARLAGAAAAAAAAACLAVAIFPSLTLLYQADYLTGDGERKVIALSDGSSVELDAGSAIALDDDGAKRGVRLLAGRAWFNVAKDPNRPFIVAAGAARVTVTGTAFDVGLASGAVDVDLAEGSVRLAWNGTAGLAMVPGDRVKIDGGGQAVHDRAVPASMGSWRRGRLILENATLGEGVAALRRYHRGAILFAADDLATRRITGVFDSDKPVEALRLMVSEHGGTVQQLTPWLLIVTSK